MARPTIPLVAAARCAEVTELYVRPPDEFVAARDALVKALRAAGDRDQATRVARLRRPPLSAWALDLVARQAPDLITRLLNAGAALRAATGKAMVGDASSLRGAEAEERAVVGTILQRAVEGSAAAGIHLNDAHRQRMAATLRAAVLDGAVAASLRSGTLDADHEAAPLGFDPGADVAPRATRSAPSRRTPTESQANRAELGRLRQDADRLRKRAARLQAEAEEATRRAAELRADAKDAAQAAREAERTLNSAERKRARAVHRAP